METNTNTESHETTTAAPVARYAELQALVATMADDFRKFYQDGNKAAGTRVSNAMQELKTLAQARMRVSRSIIGGSAASTSTASTSPASIFGDELLSPHATSRTPSTIVRICRS